MAFNFNKIPKRQYDVDALFDAFFAVTDDGLSITAASKRFGVPVRTLGDWLHRKSPLDMIPTFGPPPLFSEEQEYDLMNHIDRMAELGYGYSRREVLDIATDYAITLGLRTMDNPLGITWYYGFRRRWPDLNLKIMPHMEEPKHSVPIKITTQRKFYSDDSMQAACRCVENGMSKTEAARINDVPRSTLKDRLKGRKNKQGPDPYLTKSEETKIATWMLESARRGFPKTRRQIYSTVQSILEQDRRAALFKNGKPGRGWYDGFIKRNRELFTPSQVSKPKQTAGAKESGWLKTVREEISAINNDVLNHPERIFNCAETGFKRSGKMDKILPPKKCMELGKPLRVLACGSASGEVLQPLLIFPGRRFAFDPLAGFPEALFAKSVEGYLDSKIFKDWLTKAFIPAVADLVKPVLLFVDGYNKSFANLGINKYCRDHDIILYQIPPHYPRSVQPLDLTTFKTFKQAWEEEVDSYKIENGHCLSWNDFALVFKTAWDRGIKKGDVVSGFKYGLNHLFCNYSDELMLEPSYYHNDKGPVDVPMAETLTNTTNAGHVDDNQIVFLSHTDFSLYKEEPPSPHSPSALPSSTNSDTFHSDSEISSLLRAAMPPRTTSLTCSAASASNSSLSSPSPCLETGSDNSQMSVTPLEAMTRLIFLGKKMEWEKLVSNIAMADTNYCSNENDVETRQFCSLFQKVRTILSKHGDHP